MFGQLQIFSQKFANQSNLQHDIQPFEHWINCVADMIVRSEDTVMEYLSAISFILFYLLKSVVMLQSDAEMDKL